ncbi:MAG TPA: Mut7-C RNAse domain-containing protein [Candidatus Lokiarchaeia archaeon]|nr:Mut7-C RNAse domain-containing protein [Candidatus Lokiarchaeia archaeon]
MRFLVDAMLGNLARWLRIFGHDVIFANEVAHPGEGGATDAQLAQFAEEDNRVLITHDKQFAQRYPGAIYVPGTVLLENLRAVQQALEIELHFDQDKARCTVCNEPLQKISDKDEVKDIVPAKTFDRYDDFWICTNATCRKVFWQGSHFEDIHSIEKKLENS